MSFDRNLTISLGFPLTRSFSSQGTPRNPISTSDCPMGSDKYGASRKSTPCPAEWLRPVQCEWRNVPWILNCCDSLVMYCKILEMWSEAIHWFNFKLMWCNGCTLDVMYACNRINFDVTNVWLSRYASQWQQKTPNYIVYRVPMQRGRGGWRVCVRRGYTSWISLDDAVKQLGRRWKTCFVCEAPVFVS